MQGSSQSSVATADVDLAARLDAAMAQLSQTLKQMPDKQSDQCPVSRIASQLLAMVSQEAPAGTSESTEACTAKELQEQLNGAKVEVTENDKECRRLKRQMTYIEGQVPKAPLGDQLVLPLLTGHKDQCLVGSWWDIEHTHLSMRPRVYQGCLNDHHGCTHSHDACADICLHCMQAAYLHYTKKPWIKPEGLYPDLLPLRSNKVCWLSPMAFWTCSSELFSQHVCSSVNGSAQSSVTACSCCLVLHIYGAWVLLAWSLSVACTVLPLHGVALAWCCSCMVLLISWSCIYKGIYLLQLESPDQDIQARKKYAAATKRKKTGQWQWQHPEFSKVVRFLAPSEAAAGALGMGAGVLVQYSSKCCVSSFMVCVCKKCVCQCTHRMLITLKLPYYHCMTVHV